MQDITNESYIRGLNDAWEAARRMISMNPTECFDCFGDGDGQGYYYYFTDGIYKITPQEAIKKIRIYTEKKEAEEKELHVGDEIICISEYSLDYNKTFIYLGRDEYHMKMFNLDKMRAEFTNNFVDYCKTGRHFDSIPLPKGGCQ